MKLRHFIYSICLASLSLTACQKEDALENTLDVTSPYALDYLAYSEDEIDQRRYEIYKEYGVAVFLNDVIKEEVVGTDYKGDPIYKRETLDISWEFYSDANTPYSFTYLISEETEEEENPDLTEEDKAALEAEKEAKRQQEREDALLALDYAETYLSMAGQTKPFSIMLLKNLIYNGQLMEFHQGFRTLYLSNANAYSTIEQMRAKSTEIIKTTFINAIQLDEVFMAEFEAVSNENHYYGKKWKADLGETFSSDLNSFLGSPYYFKLSDAFNETRLNTMITNIYMYYVKYYWEEYGVDYSPYYPVPSLEFALKYYQNMEAMQEVAMEMVGIAAKYGFIVGGWSSDTTYAPNLTKDMEVYVGEIMKLGALGFEQRYGAYPVVMQKFNLIRDYIENELNFDLNYNNL